MPNYKFVCPIHGENIITMKMSEYDAENEHKCPICGGVMTRDINSMVCGYQAKCTGFYGKSSK